MAAANSPQKCNRHLCERGYTLASPERDNALIMIIRIISLSHFTCITETTINISICTQSCHSDADKVDCLESSSPQATLIIFCQSGTAVILLPAVFLLFPSGFLTIHPQAGLEIWRLDVNRVMSGRSACSNDSNDRLSIISILDLAEAGWPHSQVWYSDHIILSLQSTYLTPFELCQKEEIWITSGIAGSIRLETERVGFLTFAFFIKLVHIVLLCCFFCISNHLKTTSM